MKYWIITFFIGIICTSTIYAQDLIVTDKGDSLNCKITQIKSDFIRFSVLHDGEIRNTLLPKDQIIAYKKNFYTKPEISLEKVKHAKDNYTRFCIGALGGWSYQLAKEEDNIPSELQQYSKKLRYGYHGGADFIYFISKYAGFGLKYSIFKAQNEINDIQVTNTIGETRIGKVKDDISIQYFGPSFTLRLSTADKKTNLTAGFSLGYMSYHNKATLIDNFTLTGTSTGIQSNLGIDFLIVKNLYLYFGGSYMLGTLGTCTYDDGVQSKFVRLGTNNFLTLSRIDLSIGLRWYK